MSTININNVQVIINRKDIKNLHIGVYPPHGKVRVATPLHVDDEAVRLAVISRFAWIKRQIKSFQGQPRQTRREMVTGESHFYMGKRYLLNIEATSSKHSVLLGHDTITLSVRKNTTRDNRIKLLEAWYREQLRNVIAPLIEKWSVTIGVQLPLWSIRKMNTKWGSCNTTTGKLLFNLELVKAPMEAIEYVVVHELCHLKERLHTTQFEALMNRYIPDWRQKKALLKAIPLEEKEVLE